MILTNLRKILYNVHNVSRKGFLELLVYFYELLYFFPNKSTKKRRSIKKPLNLFRCKPRMEDSVSNERFYLN